MAPRDSRENLEAVVSELENQHQVAEKSIGYDPALANVADTQQLGALRIVLAIGGRTMLIR